MERLSPHERAVYILREAFSYSHGEISEILDSGTPAVHHGLVNGAAAILFVIGDQVVGAVGFDIANGRIATVRGIASPNRLVRLAEAWRQQEPGTPLIAHW